MKLQSVLACLFFLSTGAYAQDSKNCEAAVDAAASMNMNQPECDYSDKGLNGFLQKAFKKGDEGATLETGDNKEVVNNLNENEKKAVKNKLEKMNTKSFFLNAEAAQWSELSAARIQLLSKAMEQCKTGFGIAGENYHLAANGKLELKMRFECE